MAVEQINAELLAALQWFEQFHRFGMRDYLAARAMQAALTNWPADAGDWMRERAELAQRAYAMADAMLEARNA